MKKSVLLIMCFLIPVISLARNFDYGGQLPISVTVNTTSVYNEAKKITAECYRSQTNERQYTLTCLTTTRAFGCDVESIDIYFNLETDRPIVMYMHYVPKYYTSSRKIMTSMADEVYSKEDGSETYLLFSNCYLHCFVNSPVFGVYMSYTNEDIAYIKSHNVKIR